MQITDDDLAAARVGNSTGLQRLFAGALPECARIATSLTGSRACASRVLKTLVRRSEEQLAAFRDGDEASRWFARQTVMLSREEHVSPELFQDALLAGVGGPDVVHYQAMIGGLRKLSRQQQEAFILYHAHRWNTRLCSVAMDCSTDAVQTHLDEADRTLAALVGEHLPTLQKALEQVHKTQPIDLPQSPQQVTTVYRRRRSWRWLARTVGWLAIALLVLLIGLAVWYLVPRVKI